MLVSYSGVPPVLALRIISAADYVDSGDGCEGLPKVVCYEIKLVENLDITAWRQVLCGGGSVCFKDVLYGFIIENRDKKPPRFTLWMLMIQLSLPLILTLENFKAVLKKRVFVI